MDSRPDIPPAVDPELLSAVLSTIGSAVVLLDHHARVRVWNESAERILGVRAAEAVGRLFSELPIAWNWEDLGSLVPGFVTDRPVRLDEVRITRPGGDGVLAFTVAPIAGGRRGCLWHGADITERRAMEVQLRQSQKLESIGGLAAGIAHEINTPMQFIGDNTRFVAEAFASLQGVLAAMHAALADAPEPSRAAAAEAERAADLAYLLDEAPKALAQSLDGIQRVARIVKAMKEFAHPGADEPVPTDLNHAIDSTLTVSRNAWKYVADVVLQLDPELPPIPVVPGGFNQVILNLVVNAAHAIEDRLGKEATAKGAITVTTRMAGGAAVVEVADTGCGIPESIRSRIFDPFFTTKAPGRGTGQGLAIVRTEIIDRLGGRIEVDSVPGQGSTFRLLLPVRQSTVTIRRRQQARQEERS